MRLEPGMLIKTNYSGPYRIKHVARDCVCPKYLDEINMDNPPPQRPHIHLECSRQDGTGKFWLNGWDEETLQSLDKSHCGHKTELGFDTITVLESDQPIQLSLF